MIRARGLRMGDVAALSGMSERKLSDYVRGVKKIRPLDMIYLCRALNCSESDLVE
jgi:DNA-binding Xre family transcriptional regulator